MVKVFVFYDSKHGNTKLAAEKIVEGLQNVEGIETSIGYIKEGVDNVACYDAIVLGAPNHMGRPSRAMQKFIDTLVQVDLKAKAVAVFGTYAGRERAMDRAAKKLQNLVQKKLPNLNLITPAISIRVNGVTGPIVEGELPKCEEFGKKIATQLKNQASNA